MFQTFQSFVSLSVFPYFWISFVIRAPVGVGLKNLFRAQADANPMAFVIGREIYGHLEMSSTASTTSRMRSAAS